MRRNRPHVRPPTPYPQTGRPRRHRQGFKMRIRNSLLVCCQKAIGLALTISLAPGSGLPLPTHEPTTSIDIREPQPAQSAFAQSPPRPAPAQGFSMPTQSPPAASGGQPAGNSQGQSRITAQQKAVQQKYRNKAQSLLGDKTVNGMPYTSDTLGRMILTRDVYDVQLDKFISDLTTLANASQPIKDARIQTMLPLASRMETARFVLSELDEAGDPYGGPLLNYAKRLKWAGRQADADWLLSVADAPHGQGRKMAEQQIQQILAQEPLLGVTAPGTFGRPLGTELTFTLSTQHTKEQTIQSSRPILDQFLQYGIDQSKEEKKRVDVFLTPEDFTEFLKPQYVSTRFIAANIWSGRNEFQHFEDFAQNAQGYTEATEQYHNLTLAFVLAVAMVVLPVIGGVSWAFGATDATLATLGTVGSVVNLGAATVQFVWDGSQFVAVTQELATAEKGAPVLGPEGQQNLQDLRNKQGAAATATATDLVFVALSKTDLNAALDKAAAERAKAAAKAADQAATANAAGRARGAIAGSSAVAASEPAALQRAQLGAVKAKELGADPATIDAMLASANAKVRPEGPVGVGRSLIAEQVAADAKQLAAISEIDTLVANARTAGVSEADIQAILKPAAPTDVSTWAKLVPNQLKIVTAIKQGKILVIDNTDLARKALAQMVGPVPNDVATLIRNNVIYSDALRLQTAANKLSFMQTGRLVQCTPEEIGLLQQIVARPDAAKIYTYIAGPTGFSEPIFYRLFTDDMVAAANQLLKSPDLPAILQGKAILPAIVNSEFLQFVPPSFLVNPETGNLVSAEHVGQLTSTQIQQLSPEFVQNAIADEGLKAALQTRMQQEAATILQFQTGYAASIAWAENVFRVSPPLRRDQSGTDLSSQQSDTSNSLNDKTGPPGVTPGGTAVKPQGLTPRDERTLSDLFSPSSPSNSGTVSGSSGAAVPEKNPPSPPTHSVVEDLFPKESKNPSKPSTTDAGGDPNSGAMVTPGFNPNELPTGPGMGWGESGSLEKNPNQPRTIPDNAASGTPVTDGGVTNSRGSTANSTDTQSTVSSAKAGLGRTPIEHSTPPGQQQRDTVPAAGGDPGNPPPGNPPDNPPDAPPNTPKPPPEPKQPLTKPDPAKPDVPPQAPPGRPNGSELVPAGSDASQVGTSPVGGQQVMPSTPALPPSPPPTATGAAVVPTAPPSDLNRSTAKSLCEQARELRDLAAADAQKSTSASDPKTRDYFAQESIRQENAARQREQLAYQYDPNACPPPSTALLPGGPTLGPTGTPIKLSGTAPSAPSTAGILPSASAVGGNQQVAPSNSLISSSSAPSPTSSSSAASTGGTNLVKPSVPPSEVNSKTAKSLCEQAKELRDLAAADAQKSTSASDPKTRDYFAQESIREENAARTREQLANSYDPNACPPPSATLLPGGPPLGPVAGNPTVNAIGSVPSAMGARNVLSINAVNAALVNVAISAPIALGVQNVVASADGIQNASLAPPKRMRAGMQRPLQSRTVATLPPRGTLQLAALRLSESFFTHSPLATWRLADEEDTSSEVANQITYSLVANGNSSGEALELQVLDPSGRIKQVEMPA